MRIRFAGPFFGLDPIILIFSVPGTYSFDKVQYPDHTKYDVMVVGAGGGYGGGLAGIDPSHSDWDVTNYGGAGGGGGSFRIQGLLSLLEDETEIIVGAAGANGDDGGDDPDASTDGGGGGYSSFGDFVIASGGAGGHSSQTLSYEENQYADGGEGGIGGYGTAPGGGVEGGLCGLNDDPENPEPFQHVPATNGQDGPLVPVHGGMSGSGGGGGAGGSIRHIISEDTWELQSPFASYGGRGSYNSDEAVFSPQGPPQFVTPSGAPAPLKAKAGRGGGSRLTPLSKSNATYGDGGKNGVVIIRLTAD